MSMLKRLFHDEEPVRRRTPSAMCLRDDLAKSPPDDTEETATIRRTAASTFGQGCFTHPASPQDERRHRPCRACLGELIPDSCSSGQE